MLTTYYVAVIVPYKGSRSPVQSARLLAIEVTFADRRDIVFVAICVR